jgi:hypothetical protein
MHVVHVYLYIACVHKQVYAYILIVLCIFNIYFYDRNRYISVEIGNCPGILEDIYFCIIILIENQVGPFNIYFYSTDVSRNHHTALENSRTYILHNTINRKSGRSF